MVHKPTYTKNEKRNHDKENAIIRREGRKHVDSPFFFFLRVRSPLAAPPPLLDLPLAEYSANNGLLAIFRLLEKKKKILNWSLDSVFTLSS